MTRQTLALLGGTPVLPEFPPRVWPVITRDDIEKLTRFLQTGELSFTGREGVIRELEEQFRSYLGSSYALSCSSGTAALHSAYFGLSVGPGDEVLVPAYTYFATVMPLFACNAVPVLVDADPETGNLDPEDLVRHVTSRTVAVAVTHNFGVPVEMRPVLDFAKAHGLKVLEDCSHAHGAMCDGRKVGTFGDVAVFSMQSKKLVPAGEGGMLVTSDREVYERATLLGHPRDRSHQEVVSEKYRQFAETGFGLKYRIHPFAAALASLQFERLEAYIAARCANADYLSRKIEGIPGIHPPVLKDHVTRAVFYTYQPIYHARELGDLPIDVFVEALRAEGVPIDRPAAGPLHLERIFQVEDPGIHTYRPFGGRRLVYRPGDFPHSEQYSRTCLRLPAYTDPMYASFDLFAEALHKVTSQLGALQDYARSDQRLRCRS